MTDLDLNALFLNWMINFGSPVIAGALFIGALGIPVPGTLIVIASGAFIKQDILSLYTAPIAGLVGAVTGDIIVYGVGRFTQNWIQNRFGQSAAWEKARGFFNRRGGIAIYLTRWLVTPIAVPTNLIAGSGGYSFSKFLLFDISGEVTWLILYGGLGYAFGSQWQLISDFISNFMGWILGVLMIGTGIYLLIRSWRSSPEEETASTHSTA